MKTFTRLLSEISQPNSEDELNFKEKHIIDPKDHPVAPDSVFSGNVDKGDIDGMKRYRKNKRIADYQAPEDADVYEGVTLNRDIPGQEDNDVDNDDDEDMTDAQLKYRRHAQIKKYKIDEAMDPVGQEDDDINNDGKVTKHDKYLHSRRKAISASIRAKIKEQFGPVTPAGGEYDSEESHQRYKKSNSSKKEDVTLAGGKGMRVYAGKTKESQIDEISKSTLGSYAAKALNRGDIAARMSHSDSDEMGKIANKRLTGVKKAVDKIAPKAAASRIKTKIDKAREAARNRYTDKDDEGKAYYAAQKGISKVREEVELDEISKSTLGRYIKAASTDSARKTSEKDSVDRDYPNRSFSDRLGYKKELGKKLNQRRVGISKAVDRLTKEEVELDEARKSSSYQFTHKPGDAESEKKLADLKQSVKGTGKRVVLQGRLGKDNPNAHKYSKDAPRAKYQDGKRVNADVSGKSGAHSHQRIQKADAAHHDVYVYDRNESVELDEISKAMLGRYIKKASHDVATKSAATGRYGERTNREADNRKKTGDMSGYRQGREDDKTADKFFKKSWSRRQGIAKATDRLTKESVELDELNKSTLGSYINKSAADVGSIQRDITSTGTKSPEYKDLSRMRRNRKAGIAAAVKKLTKEEVELDEVSQDTLQSYHAKAALDLRKKREKLDKGTLTSKDYKQGQNRVTGLNRAANKMEEVELDEAFNSGALKLNDGSSVIIKAQDAKLLNQLIDGLRPENAKKMMKVAMTDKHGFEEILGFAREAL